jgi:hypothetical protein
MNFIVNKNDITELTKRKDFPKLFLEEYQDYLYNVKHELESVWVFLGIEDCTPVERRIK